MKIYSYSCVFFGSLIFLGLWSKNLFLGRPIWGLATPRIYMPAMYLYKHIAYIITNKAMFEKIIICINLIFGNFYKNVLKKTRIYPIYIYIYFSIYKKTFLIFFKQPCLKATFVYRKHFVSFFYDKN